MLAHGERGGREGKGIGKPGFRTEDRQTTTQTVTCPRQPPTPCSLPDIPINHVAHPLLELQFVFHPALRSWPCGEVCWLLCLFFRGPRPGCSWKGTLAPDMGQTAPDAPAPRRSDGEQPPLPHPGIRACLVVAILRDDVILEGDTQCLSIPGVRGRDSAGLSSWGKGSGEEGLDPQAPVQVRLCPRRAAIRVHFSILIMEPLQHFLTDQSQAHQEGLVVKVAPLLSKRVLHGLALKVQAIFAGHLIEVVILEKGLLHHPS